MNCDPLVGKASRKLKREECEDMCMKSSDCKLNERVNAIDKRVTNLEGTVAEMRRESQDGFKTLTDSVNALGHDFGERMNLIEKKVVDEKQEWGKSFRKWLDWIVKLLIVGCGAAMGMTAWKIIFGN